MNTKYRMHDMLILLPGITGSMLEKNGVPLWGPISKTILSYIWSRERFIEDMRIKEDSQYDDLGDGVRPTKLMPWTLVPGIASFRGYAALTQFLQETFTFFKGDATRDDGPPANYFEFPYDWRRDNCFSARQLKKLIDRELPNWRKKTGNPSAKVILMAHSMGGLVARYYVECLEGFINTRALFTFGTPHRGSVEALDYLVRGYKKFGIRWHPLTDAMRSMTSVYQLLPRYPMVCDKDESWHRVWEISAGTIPHLDKLRAEEAYRGFYERIDTCYEQNKSLKEYDVRLIPIIGFGQPTLQSAKLAESGIEFGTDLPSSVEKHLTDGDGRVPHISAIPIPLHKQPERWIPWNEKHTMLPHHPQLLASLSQMLASLQGVMGVPTQGPGVIRTDRSVALEVDEFYSVNEPVLIRVTANTEKEPSAIHADITPFTTGSKARRIRLLPEGNAWMGEVSDLPEGTYQVTVKLEGSRVKVADIFEVA